MEKKESADVTISPMDEYIATLDEYPYSDSIDLSSLDIGNITISTSGSGYPASGSVLTSGGTASSTIWTTASSKANMSVEGDAHFEGDIKWKGRSLGDLLETIEKRLAILEPNPKKLAKYEALQKAYAHYKTLEALCDEDNEDDDK